MERTATLPPRRSRQREHWGISKQLQELLPSPQRVALDRQGPRTTGPRAQQHLQDQGVTAHGDRSRHQGTAANSDYWESGRGSRLLLGWSQARGIRC